MSEEFDKEAEREKLREKYEKDKQKREATEQMSELLLKGATMTNAHCSECGDPVFRYDDQEFCPTCEKPVNRGEAADGEDDETAEDSDAAGGDDGSIEVTSPSDDTRVTFGDQSEAAGADQAGQQQPQDPPGDADSRGADQPAQGGQNRAGGTPTGGRPTEQPSDGRPVQEPTAGRTEEPTSPTRGTDQPTDRFSEPSGDSATNEVPGLAPTGGIDGARQSLIRTLNTFSQKAEATDDPRQAREYLAAAREAAETLDALGW